MKLEKWEWKGWDNVEDVIITLFIVEIKHPGQNNLVGKEIKARICRQALMHRPWRDAAFWLAPHNLLNLRFYGT